MKIVTFKIEQKLLNDLDTYAATHGLLRSEVIRLAIKEYIYKPPTKENRIKVKHVTLT